MERLRTDPKLRAELGEKGYETYLNRWSEGPHLETYFRLIETTARNKFGTIPCKTSTRPSLKYRPVTVA